MIKAVIFDLDGVLTDTSTYHFVAWKETVASVGIELEASFEPELRGISRFDSIKKITDVYLPNPSFKTSQLESLAAKKNEVYLEKIKTMTQADLYPGVLELFEALKHKGLLLGLASASLNASMLIEKLGIINYFSHVSNPSLHPSKPDPGLFIEGLKALHVSPEHALGVEDAPAGIAAIKAAQMKAIGIGDPKTLKADVVFKTIADIPYYLFD
jgi:beta-phosphoglucomutase